MNVEPNLCFPDCSSVRNSIAVFVNFTSESKLNTADRIFPLLRLLVSELLTFNVNRLLNNGSYEAREILGVLLERNVIPKIQNNVEIVLLSLPDVFIQAAE